MGNCKVYSTLEGTSGQNIMIISQLNFLYLKTPVTVSKPSSFTNLGIVYVQRPTENKMSSTAWGKSL